MVMLYFPVPTDTDSVGISTGMLSLTASSRNLLSFTAGMSEARKFSPSPSPKISGEAVLAA
jgi:hypothetical protein